MEGRILHENIRQGLFQEVTNEVDVATWAGIWQIQLDKGGETSVSEP